MKGVSLKCVLLFYFEFGDFFFFASLFLDREFWAVFYSSVLLFFLIFLLFFVPSRLFLTSQVFVLFYCNVWVILKLVQMRFYAWSKRFFFRVRHRFCMEYYPLGQEFDHGLLLLWYGQHLFGNSCGNIGEEASWSLINLHK